jgi:thiol-disulfide isomerase/thioredoxin
MNFLYLVVMMMVAPADSSYTLTGTIEGLDKGWVYLSHVGATPRIDSARVQKGKFDFSGEVTTPEYCVLGLVGPGGERQDSPYFFLASGHLTLISRKGNFSSAIISGVPVQEEYRSFSANEAAIRTEPQRRQMAKLFVQGHPSSPASAFALLEYFSYNVDEMELDSLFTGLDLPVRDSYLGQQVNEILRGAKLTAVGKPAPGFTQSDVDGKAVELGAFRGNYVLVDFWASWCGPCRMENPVVVKAYRQYHSKGFAILGVSLDDQRDRWVAAIKKDGLVWTQVSDLKGWDNQVAALYAIKGIPMNFLLDKDGKIVAKGLAGDALEKKLAELLP